MQQEFLHSAIRIRRQSKQTKEEIPRSLIMERFLSAIAFCSVMMSLCVSMTFAQQPNPLKELNEARRIYVPIEEFDIVTELDREGVILPRDKFNQLLTQAKDNAEKFPVPTGVAVVLNSADYVAKIQGDQLLITVTAELNQFDNEWRETKFPLQRLAIEQARLDDQPAMIGRHADGSISLLTQTRGQHKLTLQLSTELTSQGSDQLAAFSLLNAPSGTLTLSVPAGKRLFAGSLQPPRPAAIDQTADYKIAMGGITTIQLRITDRTTENATDSLMFASTGYGLNVSPGEVTWNALTALHIFGSPASRLTFSIPKSLEVADVSSNGLDNWVISDDASDATKKTVTLTFGQPFDGTRKVSIKGILAAETGKPWTVPSLKIQGTTSHIGQIVIQHKDGIRLRVDEAVGVRRATKEQKPTADMPDEIEDNATNYLRFDAWQSEFVLRLRTQLKERELQAAVATVMEINSTGIDLQAALTVQPHFAPLFDLEVRMPSDWQVLDVQKDQQPLKWQLTDWDVPGLKQLRISFPAPIPVGSQGSIRLSMRRDVEGWPVEAQPIVVPLPELSLPQATLTEGELVVRAENDLDLLPQDVKGLDPQPLRADYERLRFQSQDTHFEAKLQITRKPSRIAARTVAFARLDHQSFHTYLQGLVEVQGGGSRAIKIALPESVGTAIRFECDDLKIVEQKSASPENGERIWTLQFAQRLRGRALITCDIETPRGEQPEFTVPLFHFVDAERQSSFVAVEASSEQSVTTAATDASGNPLAEIDPLELPAVHYRPKERVVSVYRSSSPKPSIRLTEQRFDKIPIPIAVCPKLSVSTVLGRAGEIQHRATFQIHAVGVQGLHVTFPQPVTLWATTINNRPVEVRRNGDVYLIPFVISDAANPAATDPAKAGYVATLQLFYQAETPTASSTGRVNQEPPRLTVESGQRTAVPVEVLTQDWDLYYPGDTRVVQNHSVLEPQQPLDTASVVGLWNSRFRAPTTSQFVGQLVAIIIALGILSVISYLLAQRRYIMATNVAILFALGLLSWGFAPAGKMATRTQSAKEVDLLGGTVVNLADDFEEVAAEGAGNLGAHGPRPARKALDALNADMAQAPAAAPAPPQVEQEGKKAARDANSSLHGGRLSLLVDFDAPVGSRLKTFRYVGANESSAGVPLDVDYIDQTRGFTVRFFVMALVILIGWYMKKVCIGSKIALVTLAAVPALVLIPLVSTGWQFVLDGILLGTIICIVIWTICALCRWMPGACSRCCQMFRPFTTAAILCGLLPVADLQSADPETKSKSDPVIIIPFDAGSEPLASERVFLSQEQYLSLLRLANPDMPNQPVPQNGGIFEALYAVELIPNAQSPEQSIARVNARYGIRVTTDSPFSIELPVGTVSATSATLDGKQAALTAESDRLKVTVSKSGVHVLDFSFDVPARLLGPSGSITLPLRPVAAGKLTVKLPAKDLSVRVNGSSTIYRRVSSGDAQSLEMAIDKGGEITIAWQPQQAQGSQSAVIHVDSIQALTLTDAGATVSTGFGLRVRNGSIADSSFTLPGELRLQGVSGPDVGGWEVLGEGAARQLRVTYRRNIQDQTRITIDTFFDVKVADTPLPVTVPSIAPQNVTNEIGQLALFAGNQFSVQPEKTESLTQIDTNKFTTSIPVSRPQVNPILAYRFAKRPYALTFRTSRRESQSQVTAMHAALVTLWKLHLTSHLKYHLTGSPRSSLNVKLPTNFVLLNVEANALRDWYTTKQGEQSELTIELDSPKSGDLELVIVGFQPRDNGSTSLQFPLPAQATQINTTAGVWLEEGFTGALESFEGWRSIDPTSVPGELSSVRRQGSMQFALNSTQPQPGPISLKLSQTSANLSANGLSMVTVTDDSIVYTLALQWMIESAKVDRLVFTTPAWLANRLDFQGAELGEVTQNKVEGDRIRWTLHLRTPVNGKYFATAVASLPLNPKEVVAPSLVFETDQKPIDSQRQYLLLINSSSGQLTSLDASLVEPVQSVDLPVVIEQQFINQATELVRIKSLMTSPRWSIQSYAQQPGAPASVNVADLTTVLSRDGTYRAEAVYTIKNRARQFLAMHMPEGTELLSIFVADRPSRAVSTKLPSQGSDLIQLIALPKTSEASLAFPVRIVWRGRLNHRLPNQTNLLPEEFGIPAPRILSLQDDPNFGIPVARTRWTVYLPNNLEATPVRSVSKHNLSLSDSSNDVDGDVLLDETVELLGFIEQTVVKNRRQTNENSLKQLGIAKSNLEQLKKRNRRPSRYDSDSIPQHRQAEIAGKIQEAERIVNEELRKSQEKLDKSPYPSESDSLNEGLLIANSQQADLQRLNRGPAPKADEDGKGDTFEFELEQLPTKDQPKSKSEAVQQAPDQTISNSDARVKLRRSNTQSISDLNSTISENAVSRQNRMLVPQQQMQQQNVKPGGGTFLIGGNQSGGEMPSTANPELWNNTNQQLRTDPLFSLTEEGEADDRLRTINDIESALRPRQGPKLNLPVPMGALANQQVGQAAPPQGGLGGGGGAPAIRKPTGGLSLEVELTKSGRPLVFSKSGGDPKLALSIRPTSSSQWALRLLWSVAWGVIFFGIYYTLGKPEWKRKFRENLPYGVMLIGVVTYVTLPTPVSAIGFAAFIVSAAIILWRRLPAFA